MIQAVALECECCGETYLAPYRNFSYSYCVADRFCSDECAEESRACEHCGAIYEPRNPPSQMFCSRDCGHEARKNAKTYSEIWDGLE